MTTGYEDVAKAIREGFHELAVALKANNVEEITTKQQENKIPEDSLLKMMTVGQLTAEHVGKHISVELEGPGNFDGNLEMVEHRTAGRFRLTRLFAVGVLPHSYRSDTSCEVFDD